MFRDIFNKFDHYLLDGRPIVVGLSGGPDSIFLLWALHRWNLERNHVRQGSSSKCALGSFSTALLIPIKVVHIDHGWREESGLQALRLKEQVKSWFSLDMEIVQATFFQMGMANLEEKSRQFRLEVFEKIYRESDAQALLLGHHADDQAEVVLKRCLEGSSLFAISGMDISHQMGSMRVIRPLLDLTKKEILQELNSSPFSYLVDPTNEDPRFLRGRMRLTLFDDLEEGLGKKIKEPLNALAREARLWKEFIDREITPFLEAIFYHPCYAMIPDSALPDHPALLGYLFKKLGEKYHFTLTRPFTEQLCKLKEAEPGKKGSCAGWDWIRGYRVIYLIKREIAFCIAGDDLSGTSDSPPVFAKWVPLEGELKHPCHTMRVSEKIFLVEWFRRNHLPLEWAMRFPVYQEKSTGYVTDFLTKQKEINSICKKRVVISCDSSVINKIK